MKWTSVVCMIALTCLAGTAAGQANPGRVIGTVTDAETMSPLSGVNVIVVGTERGSITGVNGQFLIPGVPAGSYTLRAQRIGYAPVDQRVTVEAGEAVTVNLSMRTTAVQLEGVVAIGYGTQQRQNVTGAISSVNTAALENVPIPSLDRMLQGTAPGVVVTQASSAPGGGISVRIRGTSSITGMSEPLYVIDGFPIDHDPEAASPGDGGTPTASVPSNPLAALNPADIESIEILKDASATAIYGSRAANGVVIITTKQGRAGRPQVSLEMSTGTQSVARRYDLLNASELAAAMNESMRQQGQAPVFSDAQVQAFGAGTDWQDAIFRNAPVRNLQGTVSGGTTGDNPIRYAVSGGYFDQDGVVIGSAFERFSLRANVQQNVGTRMRFGSSMSASRVNTSFVPTDGESNRRAGAVGLAVQSYPFLPVRLEDGRFPYQGRDLAPLGVAWSDAAELANAVSMATEVRDHLGDSRLLGNIFAEYTLLPGLQARVSAGADYASRFRDTYYPRTTRRGDEAQGQAIRGRTEILTYLNENTLTYEPSLGFDHRLTLLGGYTWQTNENARTGMSASDFVTDITGYNDIGSGRLYNAPSSDRTRWGLRSFLGRAQYGWNDRYLFTLSGRYDGSSRFAEDRRWGFFPSAAVAWRLSQEPFMAAYSDAVNELKLRASVGLTGNPGIRPYQSLARFTTESYSFGGQPVTGYYPIGVANKDLTWETTQQTNFGVDAALFNRFNLVGDYYTKRTDDLLLQVDLPSESGFGRALVNAGSVQNRGLELGLTADVLMGNETRFGLRWNSGLVYAHNRNKVLDLGGLSELRAGTISDDFKLGGTLVRVGEPIGVFYGYRSGGIVRDSVHAAQLNAQISSNPLGRPFLPGDVYMLDLSGPDGVPDGVVNFEDRTIIGSPHPDFILGWNNTLTLGAFTVSALVQGTFGNEVLNLNLWRLTGGNLATNVLRERYENRWTPENPDARYPRLGVNTVGAGTTDYNDLIIEDGSYIRLQSASLSYSLPSGWVRARGLSGARLYVSGSNLFTRTDYRGFDPEVSSFGVGNQNRGIDIGAYPSARTITVGANFTY
jgi:TonB-dependent starch-binding outer membrane protein SusC